MPARVHSGSLIGIDAYPVDFREIKGQEYAKRAVEVAAARGHKALALCPELMQR